MDPQRKVETYCKSMINGIEKKFPKVHESTETPYPFLVGKLRAYEDVIEYSKEHLEKTYSIDTILKMLESQYNEPITKEKYQLIKKELDDFEGLN